MTRRLSLFALWLLLPGLALAQPSDSLTVSDACADPAFRAFDFWIGQWVVRDAAGTQVGTSRIVPVASGCGLREAWTGASGHRGTSLNYYDPDQGTWHQDWVGSDGLTLHLAGGLDDGAMVLTGERAGEDGRVRDRIRWRPLEDGRVRQEWTSSSDGGVTWRQVFLGFYESILSDSDP